jgi:hypothetical protein
MSKEKLDEILAEKVEDVNEIEDKEYYAIIHYNSRQNINHTFTSRVFGNEDIKTRLIGEGKNRDVTKYGYDTQIDLGRNQKLITYRTTDMGTTNNINRVEKTKETLGHPFRRHIHYDMIIDGKDRLQYRRNCQETHTYTILDGRVKPLDNTFVTRVYYLYHRFNDGLKSYQIRDMAKKDKTISGYKVLDMLKYLYSAIKSYHPFFYHSNGMCKYNVEWIGNIIREIEEYGYINYEYRLTSAHRKRNTEHNTIKQKDIKLWRKEMQDKIDSGDYDSVMKHSDTIINPSPNRNKKQYMTEEQSIKRMNEIIAIHNSN